MEIFNYVGSDLPLYIYWTNSGSGRFSYALVNDVVYTGRSTEEQKQFNNSKERYN